MAAAILDVFVLASSGELHVVNTMAVGKNKRLTKGGKKGAKKKVVDPFSKKDWWQTMIEAHVDVKTTDGYLLRLFCVGFTKKRNNQIRKTSYAQHQQVRQIRKKMMEIMTREVQTNDLKEVVNKLIPDSIGKDIEKACQSIYPLHDVFVRKVKMLKKPKFELGKLMELHGEGSSSGKATGDETGAKVERADGYEPPVQESV
ncbi:PREDICTED: 40S ribosomal protein S3a-like [Mandrillus leucophaeus]|uniref:40S ribosomal protein S3a-like n=1 Tax=Mandrillus leucophaeus TaxID=9568 RepID=UPI0005F41D82|nr:PREDICTED: 40S ribosomal protein S3a-like [Mandrillus leucophaeus]